MDIEKVKDLKRAMELQIAQTIREFELTTGFVLKSIKISRDDEGIQEVKCEITMKD